MYSIYLLTPRSNPNKSKTNKNQRHFDVGQFIITEVTHFRTQWEPSEFRLVHIGVHQSKECWKPPQAGKGGKSRKVDGCGHVFKDREEGSMAEEMYTELRWGKQTLVLWPTSTVGKLYTIVFIYWQFPAFYPIKRLTNILVALHQPWSFPVVW